MNIRPASTMNSSPTFHSTNASCSVKPVEIALVPPTTLPRFALSVSRKNVTLRESCPPQEDARAPEEQVLLVASRRVLRPVRLGLEEHSQLEAGRVVHLDLGLGGCGGRDQD